MFRLPLTADGLVPLAVLGLVVSLWPLSVSAQAPTQVLYGSIENEADGLEFVNGVPFIVDIGLPAILYSLNPATGVATTIGRITGSIASNAGAGREMAFDATTNTLYGTSYSIGATFADQLMTLSTTTAQATVIGRTHSGTQSNGQDFRALAFGPPRNSAPLANAGLDQTVECAGPQGAAVTLNGAASIDPDGDPLTFTWSGPFGQVGGSTADAIVTVHLALGQHTITLTVMVDSGAMSTDEVIVTVAADTTAPTVTVALQPIAKADDDSSDDDDDSGKSDDDSSGDEDHLFQVVAQTTDACDSAPVVIADINGHAVQDGQRVVIKLSGGKDRVRIKHGLLEFHTRRAVLTVIATDSTGNSATEQVVLEKSKDDDDDSSDD